QEATVYEVVHEVLELALGPRKERLYGRAQPKEDHVRAAIAQANGRVASVELAHAVLLGDLLKHVERVPVARVILLQLEEGLDAVKGRQSGFGEAGSKGRRTCKECLARASRERIPGVPVVGLIEEDIVLVLRAKHDRVARALLQQGWQEASVEALEQALA